MAVAGSWIEFNFQTKAVAVSNQKFTGKVRNYQGYRIINELNCATRFYCWDVDYPLLCAASAQGVAKQAMP
jgi:hypothetical protein